MLRVRLIAATVIAAGAALAGCSGSSNSALFKPLQPPSQPLQFETAPPGAEVRTTDGQTCKTPCSLAVPLTAQSVSFAMNGYTQQSVAVEVKQENLFAPQAFAPNPVSVTLQALQKPAKPKPGKVAPRPKLAAKRSAPPTAAPSTAPAANQTQDNAFPPSPSTVSPVESRFPTLPIQQPAGR